MKEKEEKSKYVSNFFASIYIEEYALIKIFDLSAKVSALPISVGLGHMSC